MALPAAPAPAAAAQGDSDHDAVVGTIGVGYLGRGGILVGALDAAGNPTTTNVAAPIVGVRYWLDPSMGLDLGLGVGIVSQSASVPNGTGGTTDVPQPTATGFLIHGGVPFALANSGHFSFQVIPELNVGFGGWSQDIPAAGGGTGGSLSGSGFHLDLGARAGAEIHFGFIGLPRLSLQGTVGLAFALDSTKLDVKPNGAPTQTTKASQTAFGTTLQDNPWNIFTSNVAALYYF